MKLDIGTLQQYVSDGRLKTQKHPLFDLYLWDYTKKTTYDKLWDEITLLCRGLITDGDGNVKAYPLSKFFNYNELSDKSVLLGEPKYFDKMDGSCGIQYWDTIC